jgi:hypothetical protein
MVVGAAGVQGCGVPNKFEGRLGCTVGEPPHTNTVVGTYQRDICALQQFVDQ